MDKDGGFLNKPPLLDGSNYDYWKPRMIAFIKSMDDQAWKAVIKGWEPPKVNDDKGNPTDVVKDEEDWDDADYKGSVGNSKAMNALFNGVNKNIFRLIEHCTITKEAWQVLKIAHEGTSKVKMSKLQLLTSKFENLKMKEDESIHDFHMNIIEIANASSALGEKMSESKLVRKILRSLPKRFDMKVTAIEEAQDINKMKVDELVGSFKVLN